MKWCTVGLTESTHQHTCLTNLTNFASRSEAVKAMVHALLQFLYSFALYRGIWRLLPAVVRLMPAPGLHTCKEAVAGPPYPSNVGVHSQFYRSTL